METRPLGRTKHRVSAIGLGGMPLSIAGRPSPGVGHAVIHAALDAGVTFIDTADVYCESHVDIGHNERLIAAALKTHRLGREVLVATKGGLERPDGAWTRNGRPKHLRAACEASLRALGVEAIALYQLHAPDPDVPFEESVGALSDLRDAGKIQHVGLSNVDVEQIDVAREIVEITSVQNRCNPFDRDAFTTGVVAACEAHRITFLPYSPVGGHWGKSRTAASALLAEVGARHGATAYEICLAWLLAQSPWICPIPGASRPESIISSARAASIALAPEDLARLAEAFPVTAGDA